MNRRKFNRTVAAGATAMALRNQVGVAATRQSTPAAVGGDLVLYCGRNQSLVSPLMPIIAERTGIKLDVRFGNTAELAAQIIEEGDNTPAGLYFCQDAGALGALARAGRFAELPASITDRVNVNFRSPEGLWVGTSGRVRVLLYNPEFTDPASIPPHIIDLPEADFDAPVAWAPTNAPFQSFVTALRMAYGEDEARDWLVKLIDKGTIAFDDNGPQIEAVSNREVAIGMVNHYYLFEARAENPDIPLENFYFPDGDIGGLVNVGGAGVIAGSGQEEQALAVLDFLLSEEAQTYFAEETLEYPLAARVDAVDVLPPISTLETPEFDLTNLADLEGTLALLTEVGLI
jgi:iron(III) transport system substrate-binding protein